MTNKIGNRGTLLMKTVRIIILAAGVIPMIISGAAAQSNGQLSKSTIVASGDQADVRFTCRFKDGEVAISTDQGLSRDLTVPKSKIFLERDKNTPIKLFAGKNSEATDSVGQRGFVTELFRRLSQLVVGMETGKRITVEVIAESASEEKKGNSHLKMARVRKREKEVRFTPEAYKARTGKAPEVGQPYIIDPAVPGKVSSVTEKEVMIRFSADPLTRVALPFGEGIIKEYPDRYEIVIESRPGSLTRSGGLVGRIVDVDEQFITIDYSHPFGGETLFCDILVESVNSEEKPGALTVPHKTGGT